MGRTGQIVVNGKTYNGTMVPLNYLSDEQIANVLTYVRNSWGNSGAAVTPQEVTRIRQSAAPPPTKSELMNKHSKRPAMLKISHRIYFTSLLVSVTVACAADQSPPGMARIPDGVYRPFFLAQNDLKEVPVKSFCLDILPVTNGDFLEFVRANPRWRRSQVKRIFADEFVSQELGGRSRPRHQCACRMSR